MSKHKPAPQRPHNLFTLFNEIGIINQLASTRFERVLPENLTLSQFSVLNNFVRLGGTRTPAQLADAFQVTKGAMTNTLQKLAARGCITIEVDANDRRSKLINITQRGRQLRETAVQAADQALLTLEDQIDLTHLDDLLTRLQHIRKVLDADRN
ncbi:MAG: MarR family winged helix-turn-helix transcriptional regulator [bacterium]